jgi:hypothetical protein
MKDTDYLDLDGKQAADKDKRDTYRGLCFVVAITIIIIIVISVYFATKSDDSTTPVPATVSDVINASSIMTHIWALSNISQSSPDFHGSRSVLDGYNKSAEYIKDTLKQTGYNIWTQELIVPVWQQNTAPILTQQTPQGLITFQNGVDFQTLRYGGNGTKEVIGKVAVIANYGCNASDYDAILEMIDPICLIADGGPTVNGIPCDYYLKGFYAQNCGAAIIFRNQGVTTLSNARVRKTGYIYGDQLNQIPFLSATFTVAQLLKQHLDYDVRIVSNTTLTMAYTYNVFAETTGDASKTIVVGSHLDSVPEGPGLNDNGSGSSMNLELALLFSEIVPNPLNRIRFAWWGAEEIGLLGSYWYVNQSTPEDKANILCNLNFDMMASPNGQRQVHNGSMAPSDQGISPDTIAKSNVLTKLFADHFDRVGLAWVSDGMAGGSDYFPFLIDNIPAGGLATGAGALKTMAQRATFGGLAQAQMDPCYHLSCDTPENIDQKLLQQIAQAAADVIQQLASNPKPFPTFTPQQLAASIPMLPASAVQEYEK